MKTQLVIMAAGIGQRFGKGIKQLTPIGPKNEIIMDYSIDYAIKAGFDEVIFIIRKEIENDFKNIIGNRIKNKLENRIKIHYVFQELNKIPNEFTVNKDRKKPYGTAHAILCAKEKIDSSFLVINADDYYGSDSFKKMHEQLITQNDNMPYELSMAGFIISNTLSENGTVTRGICEQDENGYLLTVRETYEVKRVDDTIKGLTADNEEVIVDNNSLVSMNMWGLPLGFLNSLNDRFIDFLKKNNKDIKSEFLLPQVIDDMVKEKKAQVKIIPVSDKWYGLTYEQDKEKVKNAFKDIPSVL